MFRKTARVKWQKTRGFLNFSPYLPEDNPKEQIIIHSAILSSNSSSAYKPAACESPTNQHAFEDENKPRWVWRL